MEEKKMVLTSPKSLKMMMNLKIKVWQKEKGSLS